LRRVIGLLIRMAADAGSTGALQVALAVFRNARTILHAVLLKVVVDAIAVGNSTSAIWAGVAILVLLAVEAFASLASQPVYWLFSIHARSWIDSHLIEANERNEGIQHLEHPRWRDALTSTLERRWLFNDATWDLLELVFVMVALLVSLVALAPIHPLLIVVVFVAGFVNIGRVRMERSNIQHWMGTLPEQRMIEGLLRTCISPMSAPELRVLAGVDKLAAKHREGHAKALAVDREREGRQILLSFPTSAGEMLALAFGLWLVAQQVRAGNATAGDVALVLTLLRTAIEQLNNVWFSGAWFLQELEVAGQLAALLDYRSPVRTPADAVPATGLPQRSIRFENVTFRYPDTEKDVLRELDLEVPAGAVVALVGDNGSGKTTLVKLLARLYDPTEGRITVDGIDLRSLDLTSWRAGLAAAFQDYARFEFRVAETVGVGELARLDDRAAVSAAVDEGAARSVVDRMPDGLDSQLGRRWKHGHELSAGQWQKLAIARARMRAEPRVLVLDEPTAALDPTAEAEIFDRFALMTAGARKRGGIGVIVSHRFSTVRRADLIAVIDKGAVVEYGSHADLLALGGTYAELWNIQAANYGRPNLRQ
jgi:ATP-binding cassette subfamily B protein